jgi:hypothetical protein
MIDQDRDYHPDPQSPMERLMAHAKQDEHQWSIGLAGHTECAECGISQSDWQHMRQAKAQVDLAPEQMTALERQLTAQLAEAVRVMNVAVLRMRAAEHRQDELKSDIDQLRAVVEVAKDYVASHQCPPDALCGMCRAMYEALYVAPDEAQQP